METELKVIRTRIISGDIQRLKEDLAHLRYQLTQYAEEFRNMKSSNSSFVSSFFIFLFLFSFFSFFIFLFFFFSFFWFSLF